MRGRSVAAIVYKIWLGSFGSFFIGGTMFVFRKARSSRQTLTDLDAYIRQIGDEPVEWLAREVQKWGEFSYSELETAIADGQLNELIDWQERYAEVVNNTLAPMWATAMASDDSDWYVKAWLKTHGGELITQLSEESRRAVAAIILHGQAERMLPRDMAKQVRPLIGLTELQAQANVNYREKVYRTYIENGATSFVAAAQADKAALKYAGKQHRYRAETIVHTELAFAYNRGAHMGVSQAIAGGLMGRCEMVWSTAGTNRVCSRCLALKDTVVGHTDESGVTLPPLHPRCRCAIMYNEVGVPRRIETKPNKPTDLPRGLAAGSIAIFFDVIGKSPEKIGEIDIKDETLINRVLDWAESSINDAPIENAIVITAVGEIYHCTGNLETIESIIELGDKLKDAIVTHNHPIGSSNEYSFSNADWYLFKDYNLFRLRGIDEKFVYELNRNPDDIDEIVLFENANEYNFRHGQVVNLARENGFGYRRIER